jgi:S1-C subfamily serine protease
MKKQILSLTAAGLVGGALVALVVAVGGSEFGSTTVMQVSASGQPIKVSNSSSAPTPRDVYKTDAPGVVYITSTIVQKSQDSFGFQQKQSGQATGSGFVIDKSGLILTNFHVVDGASDIKVGFDDKTTVRARLVGKDPSTDIALLKVDPSAVSLHPLKLGDSSNAQVGDPVLAIGNPFNLARTLTTGVVSALQRKISAPNGFTISDVIQTDAAINPGNSGGPLLNSAGEVIGINSQIDTGGSGSNGNVGIGFAVPINTAKKILPTIQKGKRVERGWLGVSTQTIDASISALNLPAQSGALVQEVTPNSPAAKAGLKGGTKQVQIGGQTLLLGGDVILAAGGQQVKTADDLAAAIAGKSPGTKVEIKIKRGSETLTKTVTLGNRPAGL